MLSFFEVETTFLLEDSRKAPPWDLEALEGGMEVFFLPFAPQPLFLL